jgi:error-prone DNA polymerase
LRIAMIAAGFSGGEAEELRRAFGFKRSEKRMRGIEVKLREGMQRNGISAESQEQIILAITSFALYGFPESHAASFALIAYASAYLKCHYLGAFTAALLNNQPMGFYHPSTIVKDAQRHGLKVRPVDITCSDWLCTLEADENATMWDRQLLPAGAKAPDYLETGDAGLKARSSTSLVLRMGFRYAKGLRDETAQAIVSERSKRPFGSIADLAYRVPELRRNELVLLASIGALNSIGYREEEESCGNAELPRKAGKKQRLHRRDALWQVERAARFAGPLLESIPESDSVSPLAPMTPEERLVADFH